MFGGLAAKLKEKKQQHQQQQQASNAEYVSRSQQLLEEARSKRPRAEEEPPYAEVASALERDSAMGPGADAVVKAAAPTMMSDVAFNAVKQRAVDEVDALLQPSSSGDAEAPDASQMPPPATHGGEPLATVALGIPDAHVQCLLRHQHFHCGLMPLKALSPCLVCVEDTAPQSSAPSTASVSATGGASDTAKALCSSEWHCQVGGAVAAHLISASAPATAPYMRAVVVNWVWRGLLLWRRSVVVHSALYVVHQGETEQLTVEEVRRLGSSIASMRERMREYSRGHNALTRLLVALLMDLSNSSSGDTQRSATVQTNRAGGAVGRDVPASDLMLLPSSITNGLFDVVRLANQGKYEASEQAYYQTVIGSEKWRLGLYSAGDMHMRRSLEKTQRDRVRHLLNNDTAMASLHAVKRLIAIVADAADVPRVA